MLIGEDVSHIHKTDSRSLPESNHHKDEIDQEELENTAYDRQQTKNRKGLGGLAALAKNMNQWEDDLSRVRDILIFLRYEGLFIIINIKIT